MVKFLTGIAQMLDAACSFWIFYTAFHHLYNDKIFEASALIVAGIFWQRAWKVEMLKHFSKPKEQAK